VSDSDGEMIGLSKSRGEKAGRHSIAGIVLLIGATTIVGPPSGFSVKNDQLVDVGGYR
jgi:hypothetical protein